MLQAEIAGRLISPHEGYAERGDVIRDFQLFSAEGQSVLLSEYRGLSSMVLVFAGESDSANNLLSELGTHQPELTGNETRALAIVVGPQERASELRHTLHLAGSKFWLTRMGECTTRWERKTGRDISSLLSLSQTVLERYLPPTKPDKAKVCLLPMKY
jgi:hypothetical protein